MRISRFTGVASTLAIVTLFFCFSACDQVGQVLFPAPPEEGVSQDIIIGVDLPLSGAYADPYGFAMQRGFELARKELNQLGGPQITFIIEDDKSTVEDAKAAFNKLIHEHGVSIITGLAVSTQGAAAFPIAQKNGVVCFSSVSSASGLSAIGDFIFRAPLTVGVLNSNGVRLTHARLGYTRVALIYDEADVYSTSSNDEFHKALSAGGIEIATTETFQTGNTDFSAQLDRIMAANPEAIFISALAAEMPQIMIQGRALGIPDSVVYIVPELTPTEVEVAGDAGEGAIAFASWTHLAETPGNQAFIQNYRTAFGLEPEPWAAQSYATLYILAEAIMAAGSTDAIAVRNALASIENLDTILGQFSFNDDGDAVYDPSVLIVENGEVRVFE